VEFPIFSGDGLAPMQFGVFLTSLLHHVHPWFTILIYIKGPGEPPAIDFAVAEVSEPTNSLTSPGLL